MTDYRCNQTDREVRLHIEDWQIEGLTHRLEVLLHVAAEDRNIPIEGDWIYKLAERCGMKISPQPPFDGDWDL